VHCSCARRQPGSSKGGEALGTGDLAPSLCPRRGCRASACCPQALRPLCLGDGAGPRCPQRAAPVAPGTACLVLALRVFPPVAPWSACCQKGRQIARIAPLNILGGRSLVLGWGGHGVKWRLPGRRGGRRAGEAEPPFQVFWWVGVTARLGSVQRGARGCGEFLRWGRHRGGCSAAPGALGAGGRDARALLSQVLQVRWGSAGPASSLVSRAFASTYRKQKVGEEHPASPGTVTRYRHPVPSAGPRLSASRRSPTSAELPKASRRSRWKALGCAPERCRSSLEASYPLDRFQFTFFS